MRDAEISFNGPHFLISPDGSIHGEDTEENRELVRRIHACVNACEGISTDELESGIIQDLRNALADVIPLLKDQQASPAQPSTVRRVVVNGESPVS